MTTGDFLGLQNELKGAPLKRDTIAMLLKKAKYGLTDAEASSGRSFRTILPFLAVFAAVVIVQAYIVLGSRDSEETFLMIAVVSCSAAALMILMALLTMRSYRRISH